MSKRPTHLQVPKPAFAITGVVAGACTGMVIGLVVEILWRRSMVVMQAGGIAGIAVGSLAETVRFWWRGHAFRKLHQETKPTATLRR